MNPKPILLFLTTSILALFIGFLTKEKTIDIEFQDTYLVMEHLHLAILFSLFTGFITLIYFGLEKTQRPIKMNTGYWHFALFAAAVFIFITTLNLQIPVDGYEPNRFIFNTTVLLSFSIVLFLMSILVFLFGLTKAIFDRS